MKKYIAKAKLILTLAALVAILPAKSFAEDIYEVRASTVIDDNTYVSAPIIVTGATGFVAQIKQNSHQGTYDFDIAVMTSTNPYQLQFQKTCLAPVTFIISLNGKPLTLIVVENSFEVKTIEIQDLIHQ